MLRKAIPRVTQYIRKRLMQRNNFSSPARLHCPSECASLLLLYKYSWATRDPASTTTAPHTAPLPLSSLQKPQSCSSSWLYIAEPQVWDWLHFSPSPGSQPSPSATRPSHIRTWHIILCLSIILPCFFTFIFLFSSTTHTICFPLFS